MRRLLPMMVVCALGLLLFASAATATTSGGSATSSATATASATSSATASAAGAAQYQYTSALPGTGGVQPAVLIAIIPAILLVGGGLLSARLIRRV